MGGNGISYVQYLRNGKVVNVTVAMFYALCRPRTIGRRRPPVGYAVSECDIGQRCPGDYAQAWYAPAQACDQAHERQKDIAMLKDVMANLTDGVGEWIRNVVEVVRKVIRERKNAKDAILLGIGCRMITIVASTLGWCCGESAEGDWCTS